MVQRSGPPADWHVCLSLTKIISICLGATGDLRAPTKSGRKTLLGYADLRVKLSVKNDDGDDDFF